MQEITFKGRDEKLESAVIPQGEFTWTGENGRYEFSIAAEKSRPEDVVKIIVERRGEKSPWLKIHVEPHGLVMLRVTHAKDNLRTFLYRVTPRLDWKAATAIAFAVGVFYMLSRITFNAL